MRRSGVNSKQVIESIKDYSLAISLLVGGLTLMWLAFFTNHSDGFFLPLAGICSILASLVSAILMRFFHH
jgi:hypothetical protein